jgi:hypothetical protein
MEKVVRNGKVAVIFSPEFGAGWYTWNQDHPEIVFDPNLVYFIETKEIDKLRTYVELKYPDLYLGGFEDLAIMWLNKGTEFKIDEYDGKETIVLRKRVKWLTA